METITIIKRGFMEKKKKAAWFRAMFVAWKLPVNVERNVFLFVPICLKVYSIIFKKLTGGYIFCRECGGREEWESKCHCPLMCRNNYNFRATRMPYLFKKNRNRNMTSSHVQLQRK